MAFMLLIFHFTVDFLKYMIVGLFCVYGLTLNLYEELTSMYVEPSPVSNLLELTAL
jgi:hypothetical protein